MPDDTVQANKATLFAELPRLISAAPHRLLFAAGASAVIVSMLWWAIVLVGARSGWTLPAPPVPPGWAHALLVQFGMLGPFLFGFLLTVFPRWLNRPALARRHYVPVFAGVFGGYLLAHIGLLTGMPAFAAGLALTIAGWIAGLVVLGRVLLAAGRFDQHAASCYAALLSGAAGLIAFAAALATQRWLLVPAAVKLGTFGLLLPIYFTVCHRMVPFFSANLVPGYRMVRPAWSLPLLWLFSLAHLVLELAPMPRWLWLVDAPFALYFLAHSIAWQPWKARVSGLLLVLHLALFWLPLAFALYSLQSFVLFAGGETILGRAPVLAHPLPDQAAEVAVLRVLAETRRDPTYWFAVAACAWIVAFLPWVLRSLWIYASPRADGAPG